MQGLDWGKIKVHPAAAIFPIIGDDELKVLADDIAMNGQVHPIIVSKGVLIDGRNRLAACALGKIEPVWQERDFRDEGEIVRFVIAANERRRHLTPSQRSMIAAELANINKTDSLRQNKATDAQECATEPKQPAIKQEDAAKAMGVSRRSVQDAKKVSTQAPELAAQVKEGKVSVATAAKLADAPAKAREVAAGTKTAKAAMQEMKDEAPKKAKAKPDPKPKPEPSAKADDKRNEKLVSENTALHKKVDELGAQIESMGQTMAEMEGDIKSLNEIIKADDAPDGRVKKAVDLEKKARDLAGQMKSRMDGMMREKNEAVQAAKRFERSVVRLEKELEIAKNGQVAGKTIKK